MRSAMTGETLIKGGQVLTMMIYVRETTAVDILSEARPHGHFCRGGGACHRPAATGNLGSGSQIILR